MSLFSDDIIVFLENFKDIPKSNTLIYVNYVLIIKNKISRNLQKLCLK